MPTRPTSDLIAAGALSASEVKAHLEAARARVLMLTADLDGERLLGPKLAIVNPILWELGHLAWFQEHWCLRQRANGARGPSIIDAADALYDSTAIPHDSRWELPLLSLEATRGYLEAVLCDVSNLLAKRPEDDRLLYFAELAACHEDMHAEAFHYTRQTLGYPAPALIATPVRGTITPSQGDDAELSGGRFLLGAAPGNGFVFDNEKWAHEIELHPFRLARQAVTNREFAEFVDADGYERREWWSEQGWQWRESLAAPRYWERRDGVWGARRFDSWQPLELDEPVIHVGWYEAEAFCRFARRRLPTEAEWEFAACNGVDSPKPATPWGDRASPERANLEGTAPIVVAACPRGDSAHGCRQLFGNVWEWTATTFDPYPGFTADPYKEYSEPWFGTHKVLRGGSFATAARLIRNTWRNFYTPDRYDVFAGFRTCAL
jgi:iron(II)-dependent oxidoreductase